MAGSGSASTDGQRPRHETHDAGESTTQLRINRPSSHDRVDIKPTPAHGRRETPSLLCLDRDSLADSTDSVGLNLDNR